MPAGRTPLPLLGRKLRDRNLVDRVPPYREIYNAVLDGRIPAEQDNGRWSVADPDLPLIAAILCPVAPDAIAA